MVTEKNSWSAPIVRYGLGTVMIWLGVLTWAPFILLHVAGEKPSLFWFLPFHLIGVIGGSRLRSVARREMGIFPEKRNLWRLAAHGLIVAGIGVWAPYFYFKLVVGQPVNVMNYLPFHLGGIFAGIALLMIGQWVSKKGEANL
jgi:hypothetical protein